MTNDLVRRNGAPPRVIQGVTFLCWSEPFYRARRNFWQSQDRSIRIDHNHRMGSKYSLLLAGTRKSIRALSLEGAMKRAIKELAALPNAQRPEQNDG